MAEPAETIEILAVDLPSSSIFSHIHTNLWPEIAFLTENKPRDEASHLIRAYFVMTRMFAQICGL